MHRACVHLSAVLARPLQSTLQAQPRALQPRCSIDGCGRRSNGYGRCVHHRHDGKRVVRPVRRADGRILAWGRLSITRDTARAVALEAKRREMSPTGLLAAIVETWAQARADAPPSRRLTVCRAPGCERAVYARGLCRPHEIQERKGQPLRPIQNREQEVRMGSLRLPVESARRLRMAAEASGLTFAEALRRALAAALEDTPRLADLGQSKRGGETVRLVGLRLSAELAERLSVVAQEFGLPVSEVIRRGPRCASGRGSGAVGPGALARGAPRPSGRISAPCPSQSRGDRSAKRGGGARSRW